MGLYKIVQKSGNEILVNSIHIDNKNIIVNNKVKINKFDRIYYTCINCGKDTNQDFRYRSRFLNLDFTCEKCAKAKTNIERFGVANPGMSEEKKEKIRNTKKARYGNEHFTNRKKAIQTMVEKYGVEYAQQNKQTREKTEQTNIERYGYSNPLQNKKVYSKMLATKKEKYGDENFTNREKYATTMQSIDMSSIVSQAKLKASYNSIISRLKECAPLFSLDEYLEKSGKYQKFYWQCNVCGTKFEDSFANGHIPRCPACHPKIYMGTSNTEKEVYDFIISLGVQATLNDYSIISPKEIDIYIPNHHFGIEFDGLYWHSELQGKDKQYHLEKTVLCLEKGIQLLHVFEDEWIDKNEIVKSIIKSKLGIYDSTIGARKCQIQSISNAEASVFYEVNHLQGSIASSLNIGLIYHNELISCLSFSKPRFNKKYSWEITRFANKLNTKVIGSFAKMFSYFTKSCLGSIITYSDKRYFDGAIYSRNGFIQLQDSCPSYYYTDYIKRVSRMQFQKHKLQNLLESFDPELTEWENMQINGWDRIWDCGNHCFAYFPENS